MSDGAIFLIGYYGRGNFGDDYMLKSLLENISVGKTVYVLAGEDLSLNLPENVRIVPRKITHFFRTLFASKTIVQAGGTIFHDSYVGKHYYRYMFILTVYAAIFAFARLLGKSVHLLGVGVGPLKSSLSKAISKRVFLACGKIVVRDSKSKDVVDSIIKGSSKSKNDVVQGVDLTFLGGSTTALNSPEQGDFVLGISLCDLSPFFSDNPNSLYWGRLAEAVNKEAQNSGCNVAVKLLSLYEGASSIQDSIILSQFATLLNLESTRIVKYEGNVDKINQEIVSCDAIISAKFHGILSAVVGETPVLGVSYNNKVIDFCNDSQMACLSLNDLLSDDKPSYEIGRLFKRQGDVAIKNMTFINATRSTLKVICNEE